MAVTRKTLDHVTAFVQHVIWWIQESIFQLVASAAVQSLGLVISGTGLVIAGLQFLAGQQNAALPEFLRSVADWVPAATSAQLIATKPVLEAAGKSIDILKKRARPIEKVDLLGIHSTGGDALRALLKDDCRILKLSQIDAFQSVLSYVGAAFRIIGGAKGDVSVYLFLVNPTELKVVHSALNDTDLAALNDPKSAARRAASTERAVMSTSPEFDIAIGRLVPVRSGETNSGSLFVYPLKDLGSSTAQYVVSVHLSRSRSLRKSDVKLMSRVLADVEPVMLLIEKRT